MASRHTGRVIALMGLYQIELTQTPIEKVLTFKWYEKNLEPSQKELGTNLIKGVVKNWELIDTIIKSYIKNNDLDRISIVNRCILRLSLYSLINQKEIPPKVIIDEAIELAKEFETEGSAGFINAILDTIYRDEISRQSGEI